MNKYELAVVYNPTLEEEAYANAQEAVKALIERFGGTVEKVDDWGKKRLAYEIQKLREGIYNFVTFTGDANTPVQVEKRMRIMDNVLRYLITRVEE